MNDDEQYFIAETISLARGMSFGDCLRFVRGLEACIDKAHPAAPQFKMTLDGLVSSDAQFELLQLGQLKLQLREENMSSLDRTGRRGNTRGRRNEVQAFLTRHHDISDSKKLAVFAIQEGLYSPKTSKCDIEYRLKRTREHLVSQGELLKS